ncbi:MAG: DUF4149 domain-containing protein [Zetaproteobacteria bacterium]|nr:MAG: DUF4149 domain-containing protein [Zetaproteobacteria bacterium]
MPALQERGALSSRLRLCLAAAGCRLALALMLGLLVVPGFVAAPLLFAHAPSRMEAGMLAGALFHAANQALLLLAAAVAAFWLRLRAAGWPIGRLRWLALLLIVLAVALNLWGLAPAMEALKQAMPHGYDALAPDDPLRRRFALLHGISSSIHLVASLAAALLVALGVRSAAAGEGSCSTG